MIATVESTKNLARISWQSAIPNLFDVIIIGGFLATNDRMGGVELTMAHFGHRKHWNWSRCEVLKCYIRGWPRFHCIHLHIYIPSPTNVEIKLSEFDPRGHRGHPLWCYCFGAGCDTAPGLDPKGFIMALRDGSSATLWQLLLLRLRIRLWRCLLRLRGGRRLTGSWHPLVIGPWMRAQNLVRWAMQNKSYV